MGATLSLFIFFRPSLDNPEIILTIPNRFGMILIKTIEIFEKHPAKLSLTIKTSYCMERFADKKHSPACMDTS